jgi:zinc/manganese transport system substrate-binding protein
MTRRPALLAAAAAATATLAAVALAGCATDSGSASASDGVVRIVASTNVYGDLAETLGGSTVQVTSVIDDPDKDPHEYEADARTQLALSKADIIVENGGGYDDFMDTMRKAAKNTDATVLNAADLSGKDQKPADGEFNEHVWYDYPTVQKVVSALSDAIVKAEPSAKSTVEKNEKDLSAKLDGLIADEAALKKAAAGKGVAITEPVPLYMLEAAGLENRTPEKFSEAVEEGTDVPPLVLQETLALFADHRVDVLVYNAQTSGPQTEAVVSAAKKADIPVVPVTETLPKGTHYIAWQQGLIQDVATAVGAGDVTTGTVNG